MSNESLVEKGSLYLPGSYSTISQNVDNLFYFTFLISILIASLIFIATFVFIFKYKKTKDNPVAKKQLTHNNLLEATWTIIPLIIVMIIFYWGFTDYLKLVVAPDNAVEIRVTGKKWYWSFYYPDSGAESTTDLFVPVGQPVKLVMSSEDVLHSFFIPNFRVKKDVQPNRYSNLWFEATKQGQFQIFCTEYCGDAHSSMLANLHVLSRTDYRDKIEELAMGDDLPLDLLGEKLYKKHGCFGCHSVDGSEMVGPSWLGLYGKTRNFTDGTSVAADDNYIRESIVYPAKKIVSGYPNVMASYAGQLDDRELNALIEYIKTLK
tara:strand:+ start:5979 stop:6938 length:960 start_codon:yes stop_codon:yes gene_type:complete